MAVRIELVGGPRDGEVTIRDAVPQDGSCEIADHHCYEYSDSRQRYVYYPMIGTVYGDVVIEHGSHKHLCRVVGKMVQRGELSHVDAVDIFARFRAWQYRRKRVLELMYDAGCMDLDDDCNNDYEVEF